MIAIVDSFAWIEFLAGSEHEGKVGEVLATAEVAATPDLVLAEVARKLARDGIGRTVVRRKISDISTLSQVIPVNLDIALGVFEADVELRQHAKSSRLNSPGLSDAVILSTARTLHGRVLTGDPHFRSLSETIWLGQ